MAGSVSYSKLPPTIVLGIDHSTMTRWRVAILHGTIVLFLPH